MRVIFPKKLVYISKPRCASTTLRNVLTKFIRKNYPNSDSNYLMIDHADKGNEFHPHITAPYLRELLKAKYKEKSNNLEYFTVIRNPIDMLISYYYYFQPDIKFLFNYHPEYCGEKIGLFDWLIAGRVGSRKEWLEYGPLWISDKNLSPLSLEAHGFNKYNKNTLDHIFLIEEKKTLECFLSNKLGTEVTLKEKCNQSNKEDFFNRKKIPESVRERIICQFPFESKLYNI